MDVNGLFSFLNDDNYADTYSPAQLSLDTATHKRKAEASEAQPPTDDGDISMHDLEGQLGLSNSKKAKISSVEATVLDSFETEGKREVVVSGGFDATIGVETHMEIRHQVRHEVAVPAGYNYIPIASHVPPSKPDREYRFELDPFQKVSIYAIQRNESVLIMREVAWVIFDEIHYMRDKERGVVWEETIILLPHTVRYVFLSATIPNAVQFSQWICKLHEQPCHVVYTDFRPTPLQHYLFPAGHEGIYLVVNEKGEFREDSFAKAMGALQESRGQDPADLKGASGKRGKSKKGGEKKEQSDIFKIMQTIKKYEYNPTIVFAFSKRECEGLALSLVKSSFNSEDESDAVANVFNNAIDVLSVDDRQLPQIAHLLPLLRRGIGIHHGGLLPILKEVVEILFQEGLIKVLFATETFSIGLNMPAKTVVFTSTRKFDGHEFRNLSSGEYIQMSGRAGRRGLDDRGVVIMMCDEKLEPAAAKAMVKGEADRLDSAFHIGYNMMLNLMKVEGISPEFMLQRCFFQFQNMNAIPLLEDELKKVEEWQMILTISDEHLVADYYDSRQQLDQLGADFREIITHPTYSLPFLQPGRIVKVKYPKLDFGWGVVIDCHKRSTSQTLHSTYACCSSDLEQDGLEGAHSPHNQYILNVLLCCASGSVVGKERECAAPMPVGIQPCPKDRKGVPLVVPVLLSCIDGITALRIFLPKDLRPISARETAWKSVLEVHRRFPDGIGLLDPIENLGIKDAKFSELIEKIHALERKLLSSDLHRDARLPELFTLYTQKQELNERIRLLKRRIQATHDILQMEELKCRKRVLRRLGFTTTSDIVDVKGRVACEISSGDELLVTELIFNGLFNPLSPEQCAAILSCFVFTEKGEQMMKVKEELAAPLRVMQEVARRIAKVSKESKLEMDEDEYVTSFRIDMMDAVLQWCRGSSFADICKLTHQFEGNLIRVFRRLGELLRQVAQAANVVGNEELKKKFERASELLERPNTVIFASSLYL
ncbi:hypothetical protein H0H93_006336 [Arthromyces matolae]|nr:hypothetical protein H0H93_006336 [Arthromyces matolae]